MKANVKQEIEVKLRVEDAAAMRRRLGRLGGRVVRRVHEMNTLYDSPQETLRKQGRLMRLRVEKTLGGGLGSAHRMEDSRAARRSFASLPSALLRASRMTAGRTRYVLTFKGPTRPERGRQGAQAVPKLREPVLQKSVGKYKVREEMEFVVGDPRAFWAVAGPAGMRPSFRYEKYRTSYRVPRAGGVHVELDETPAGVFLELEGPRRAIDRMARRLGFGPADYITRSYAQLHFEDCRRRGVRPGGMVFGTKKK